MIRKERNGFQRRSSASDQKTIDRPTPCPNVPFKFCNAVTEAFQIYNSELLRFQRELIMKFLFVRLRSEVALHRRLEENQVLIPALNAAHRAYNPLLRHDYTPLAVRDAITRCRRKGKVQQFCVGLDLFQREVTSHPKNCNTILRLERKNVFSTGISFRRH